MTGPGPCTFATAGLPCIPNGQSYMFSVSGSIASSASHRSTNVFKKDPGFAGVVTNAATEQPIAA